MQKRMMWCSFRWGQLKLWQKLLVCMTAGVMLGHFAPQYGVMLRPLGAIYVNMIKVIVIPLMLFSIVNGVSSVGDVETFNRLGKRALKIYVASTTIAISVGLAAANIFKPGVGINLGSAINTTAINTSPAGATNLVDIVVNLVPSNIFAAMSNGNIVQVVLFSIFCGFSLLCIGEKGNTVRGFVTSATHLVFKMVEIVVSLAPYGVLGLMADIVGTQGLDVLFALAKFTSVVLCGLFVQYIVSGLFVLCIGKLHPLYFYKKMLSVYALAIATSSSKATLTTAMEDLHTKMGVSNKTASFILPLGTTVNMDATAIYLGVSAVFFAQVFGVNLSFHQYCLIAFTATIGIIGAAGVPSGGVLMLSLVLSVIGLPLDGIVLVLGVDRFIDMFRTMININGDCAATIIVDNMEGTLDKKVYYGA